MHRIQTNIDTLGIDGLTRAINYGLNRIVEIKRIESVHPMSGFGDQNTWMYEAWLVGNANLVRFIVFYNPDTLRIEADVLK